MNAVQLEKNTDARALYAARAELVLARPDHRALREVGLAPDPLQRIAAAFAGVRTEVGEEAELVLDLVPVAGEEVARRRRRLIGRAQRRGHSAYGERLGTGGRGAGGWGAVLMEGLNGGRPSGAGGTAKAVRQVDLADGVGKFVPGQTVFAVQLLVRTTATHPARARARLHQVLAALDAWSGENWWRPVGPRRLGWRPYSNVWWRRRSFDRRLARGEFAPAGRQWATAAELAGLLKPPTAACEAVNVKRCGGVVPPAPSELPTWSGQPDVLPLGRVTTADGRQRLAGARVGDVLFGAFFGRSGFGKTELGLLQAIARAYAGDGVWFLDPHGEALARARPYLAHPAIAARMWEINLAKPRLDDRVTSWNPLSMAGRRAEDVQDVVGAVVGAISTAQGWGDHPRARTILSKAVRLLAELSYRMCQDGRPDLQPTLFQIPQLLTDELWRQEILAHLDPALGAFWRTTFPNMDASAVPTVTYALERLENSLSLKAFLGNPISAYDVRRAMDEQQVVFVAPSGTGDGDELITSLLLFDLFRAGLSRQDTPVADRRTLWAWVDELTAVDGASHGSVAKILEQLRKYELRFMGMTQMAMRLSDTTRAALMQNQSLLSATGADFDEAAYVAKRLDGIAPATLQDIDRYAYVMTCMHRGKRTPPFQVRGVPIDQVLADYYNPDGLPALDAAIDTNLGRRTVADILATQRDLAQNIADHLATGQTARPDPSAAGDIVHHFARTP
ncbi:ATP/GTP-binding protein [Streptomyces sp. NPDC050315]|uniref:ATP/GTP-binding protein n=1 Tax=Streptomyces sp. NPDC050315 TaxID=3155039 RepID=UPI00343620A6